MYVYKRGMYWTFLLLCDRCVLLPKKNFCVTHAVASTNRPLLEQMDLRVFIADLDL